MYWCILGVFGPKSGVLFFSIILVYAKFISFYWQLYNFLETSECGKSSQHSVSPCGKTLWWRNCQWMTCSTEVRSCRTVQEDSNTTDDPRSCPQRHSETAFYISTSQPNPPLQRNVVVKVEDKGHQPCYVPCVLPDSESVSLPCPLLFPL